MKKHEVSVDELMEWQQDKKVLFTSNTIDSKKIYATLRGSYEVWHKNKKILETMQPFFAVEKYNSL